MVLVVILPFFLLISDVNEKFLCFSMFILLLKVPVQHCTDPKSFLSTQRPEIQITEKESCINLCFQSITRTHSSNEQKMRNISIEAIILIDKTRSHSKAKQIVNGILLIGVLDQQLKLIKYFTRSQQTGTGQPENSEDKGS